MDHWASSCARDGFNSLQTFPEPIYNQAEGRLDFSNPALSLDPDL